MLNKSAEDLNESIKISAWFSRYSLANRIRKIQDSNVTGYILDPNSGLANLLCETDSAGAVKVYYVYGMGLVSKIEGSKAYFYQYDGLGSTVAITDKDGIIKNKYAYDDFGNLASNSTETISNPFKYIGQYGVMTDTPDLLYMRARYYSPTIGRFINKDPIGGLNLYNYVNANPIMFIDPLGLQNVSPQQLLTISIIISQVDSPMIGPADIVAAGIALYSIYQIQKGLGPESYPGAAKAKISKCGFPPLRQKDWQPPKPPKNWWAEILEKVVDLLGEFLD